MRDALERSVTCGGPPGAATPGSCRRSRRRSRPSPPARAGRVALSSRQRILVAEKYGSRTSPVRSRTVAPAPRPSAARRPTPSAGPATRWRCRWLPVFRSHRIAVSRWLVMPMAAMAVGVDARQRHPGAPSPSARSPPDRARPRRAGDRSARTPGSRARGPPAAVEDQHRRARRPLIDGQRDDRHRRASPD